MKYYKVTVLVAVDDTKYSEWDSQCDEIFHGPAGDLHNPNANQFVRDYSKVSYAYFKNNQYKLFTEEGGI